MFKLSRLTDYAILIVASLSDDRDALLSTIQLAEKTNLPLATIRKVLAMLSKHELVVAQQGVNGGYVLTKASSHISLFSVIEAIEGVNTLASCLDHQHCMSEARCQLQSSWQTLHYWLVSMTQQVSIADMIQGCHHHPLHALFQSSSSKRLAIS